MNALTIIAPYRFEGMWVFDDERVGLVREPFVAGIDLLIDKLVQRIADAEKGFRLIFSATEFPGYDVELSWRREESGGNWYYCSRYAIEGWLCPALYKYFHSAPSRIYCRVEAKVHQK